MQAVFFPTFSPFLPMCFCVKLGLSHEICFSGKLDRQRNDKKRRQRLNHLLRPLQPHELFPAVYALMQQSFPLAEYRTFADTQALLSRGDYELLVHADADGIIGLIAHWKLEDFLFVEHFAVSEQRRGSGIGGALMKAYVDAALLPVILEVEASDSPIAKRRIAFYQRLGFTLSDFGYEQPCLQGGVAHIPLLLMHSAAVSGVQLQQAQRQIFRTVYRVDSRAE